MPQNIDPIPVGAAPQIVVEQLPDYMLTPSVNYYVRGPADVAESPACRCELQLTVNQVEEADSSVELEVRWFIDYDLNNPATQGLLATPISVAANFDGVTTRTVDKLIFDFDTNPKITTGPHVLDVVIAAHGGFDDSINPPPPLSGRAVRTGFQSTAYRMIVQVDPTPNALTQRCPNSGASVRVGCKE